MRLWPLLLLLPLSGCFDAPIPDDAVRVTHPELPGLVMDAWTQDVGKRVQINAVVENTGDTGYWFRLGCEHPWDVSLTGPEGRIGFREVLEEANCAPVWDVLQPRQKLDILYSWDFQDHDPEHDVSVPVAGGVYQWSVAFMLRDFDARLEVTLPVTAPERPLPLAIDALGHGEGPYHVDVSVQNQGGARDFQHGCMTEWSWRILRDGVQVPLEPMGSCDGFQEERMLPGQWHNATFTWDGLVWNGTAGQPAAPGQYTWEVRFYPTGAGPDRRYVQATADFDV